MNQLNDIPLNGSAKDLFVAGGVFASDEEIPDFMRLFVSQADQSLSKMNALVSVGKMKPEKGVEFQRLLILICTRILMHPIIANNVYLRRFARGVTEAQARFELQQFSIFAHNFDVAQAQLVVNAPTREAYLERLQVLLNEKGIPYKDGFEGELTGVWNLKHVHFMWLNEMATGLGLRFEEVGKKKYAFEGTRQFVDATFKYYASDDLNVMLGAAFAIENWAGNYLWTPWISGMNQLNACRRANRRKEVKIGYLKYHAAEERHHSQATIDELLDHFQEDWFDAVRFLESAEGILNEGVLPYYESQLKHLPEKQGGEWPDNVCSADPYVQPRAA
jgi:pyrroloquinoline quinone (PQQ) biosynthesis protein C